MCMSCGCGDLTNDHGDRRNITLNDLREAARAGDESVEQCCDNLAKAMQQAKQQEKS